MARRWRRTAVSKAFYKWRAESAFAASTRGMLARRAASGFAKRAMAAGFVRWAAAATERVASRRRLFKIVARMSTATVRRAWEGWIDRIERRARALASLEAAIARWTRRALVASFRAWFARCGELRSARSAAAKALGAWRSRYLFRCFRRWTDFASQRAKLVTMLDRIVARWTRRRVSAAFDRWDEAAAERRRLRRLLGKVRAKAVQNTMSRAFAAWLSDFGRCRTARTILGRVANRALATAWRTWLAHVDGARRARLSVARGVAMACRLSLRLRANAFRGWRAAHQWGGFVNRLARRNRQRWTVKNLRGFIRRWIEAVDEKKESVEELRRCLVRKRVAQRWFLRWYWDAFDSDIQSALANILGSTESAMEDAFSPSKSSREFPPSAIRGVRPLPRDMSDMSDDAEDAYMSGATVTDGRDEDYSDSPLSDSPSPDALGAAAEKLFARGQRISIGKDKDVRMAREMLGSGGGARARREAGLVPAHEDSSGDEDDLDPPDEVEAGGAGGKMADTRVDTAPEQRRPGLESFSSKYDRVMKGER